MRSFMLYMCIIIYDIETLYGQILLLIYQLIYFHLNPITRKTNKNLPGEKLVLSGIFLQKCDLSTFSINAHPHPHTRAVQM